MDGVSAPHSAADYASQAADLLPQGAFWDGFRQAGGVGRALLEAKGVTWAAVEDRARSLLAELRLDGADETLAVREREAGLPDPCAPDTAVTPAERRAALLTRWLSRGGAASAGAVIALAATLGYQVTVTRFRPATCGLSACAGPDPVGPPALRLLWRVTVAGPRVTPLRCGEGVCGRDPLARIVRASDLECLLARIQPAHGILAVGYHGV